jgi:hypothetical protein
VNSTTPTYLPSNCNNFSNLPIREAVMSRIASLKYTYAGNMEWKIVPGFPEYEISTTGLIRHNKSYGGRPRILVQTLRNNKYFYVTLSKDNGRIGYPVDRLMIMSFYNLTIKEIKKVKHVDSIKYNNQLKNLIYTLK